MMSVSMKLRAVALTAITTSSDAGAGSSMVAISRLSLGPATMERAACKSVFLIFGSKREDRAERSGFETFAHQLFVVFADARPRDGLRLQPMGRHPPARNHVGDRGRNRRRVEFGEPVVQHHHGKRSFLPAAVGHGDNGDFTYAFMGLDRRFEHQRGYPFAAGLDGVLQPVGQRKKSVRVHGAEVAGL